MAPLDIVFKTAGMTDIGKKRKTNQDSFFCSDEFGLYIVADGMGGQQGGDVASRIAVQALHDHFKENSPQASIDESLSLTANRLVSGIHQANRDVFHQAENDPSLKGMGTTVSAALFTDQTLVVANVGDSPVFLIRDNQLEELFVSHSMASGVDTDASLFPGARHMLTRAVGVDETVRVDSCEIQCFHDDIVVLCSDGLSNMVDKDEIRRTAQGQPPAEACQSLVARANENGGSDNITIIIVKVLGIRHNKKRMVWRVLNRLFR